MTPNLTTEQRQQVLDGMSDSIACQRCGNVYQQEHEQDHQSLCPECRDDVRLDEMVYGPDAGPWHDCVCPECGSPARWRSTNLQAVARTGDETLAGKQFETLHMGPGLAELKDKATKTVDAWDLYMRAIAEMPADRAAAEVRANGLQLHHSRFTAMLGQLRDVLATWDTRCTASAAGELSTPPARTAESRQAPAPDSVAPGERAELAELRQRFAAVDRALHAHNAVFGLPQAEAVERALKHCDELLAMRERLRELVHEVVKCVGSVSIRLRARINGLDRAEMVAINDLQYATQRVLEALLPAESQATMTARADVAVAETMAGKRDPERFE